MAERSEAKSAKQSFASKISIILIFDAKLRFAFLASLRSASFSSNKLTINWSLSPQGLNFINLRMTINNTTDYCIEPSLYTIKSILILDNDGERIVSQYYDKELLPTVKEQKDFEKTIFKKTAKSDAEIVLLEGLTIVYKANVDLLFYVIGSSNENELLLDRLNMIMARIDF